MKKSSLIGHTIELLDLVRRQRRPADTVVAEFFRNRHYIGSKERRSIAEALYAILRNYLLLEARIRAAGPNTSSQEVGAIELYAGYARTILHEEPAAIKADLAPLLSGSQAPPLADLLHAFDIITVPREGTPPSEGLSLEYSIPQTVVAGWIEQFGEDETRALCRASNGPAPTTVRVNTLRCTVQQCQEALLADGVETTKTPLSPLGLWLEKRVNVQSLRAFREGWFELQDEGSQLLSVLLEPLPGARVVDACAGAGGKTLHIAALMENRGSILAMDTEPRRLQNLRQRAARAGVTIVRVHAPADDARAEWEGRADAVLVDAPCTGVGTFRRNPGAKMALGERWAAAATPVQRRVLHEYASLVRTGGRLVYATCSLMRQENEEIVEEFLRLHTQFQLLSAPDILLRKGINAGSPGPYLHLLPHKTNTDGFFGVVMQKES